MIVSVKGAEITKGMFVGSSKVVGSTRDECLDYLSNSFAFAEDLGASIREDGVETYTMVGGAIYKIEITGTVSFEHPVGEDNA